MTDANRHPTLVVARPDSTGSITKGEWIMEYPRSGGEAVNEKVETLEQEMWRKAVEELEGELFLACPSLKGSRLPDESYEQYARRGMAGIERALVRLAGAREMYRLVKGGGA